ncbi:MAG: cytochrome c family protein [Sphingomonas sp. 28-66-16]|nr:MAG: cytochrome c family protein [Sphingomonas sp. 28-66-16]
MDIRTNTIAGWILAALFVALGLGIVSGKFFHTERPEKMGYPIEGVVEAGGGAEAAAPDKPIEVLLASADVSKGADVFKKCTACHSIAQGGANGIGPNLWATVGEEIAAGKGGYAFSDALKTKGAGQKWTFSNLNDWLKSPRKFAEGTKMTFAGLASAEDRANVIVYLNSQGSNLPLPAAPAETAPADAPAADNAAAAANAADAAPAK